MFRSSWERLVVGGIVLAAIGLTSGCGDAAKPRAAKSTTTATESTTTTSATAESTTSTPTAGSVTPSSTCVRCTSSNASTSPPLTTPPPAPVSTNPQAGDFSGILTVAQPSIAVGDTDYVELDIRNATSHVIEPSLASNPNSVAIICAPDLSPDGRTTRNFVSNQNLFFVTSPPVGPGEQTGRGGYYAATADDLGTVTCEAAIVTSSDHWATMTVVGRVTTVAPASFDVGATPQTTG
jgi:hypothetical protein